MIYQMEIFVTIGRWSDGYASAKLNNLSDNLW